MYCQKTSPAENGAADAPPVFGSFTSAELGFHATHRPVFLPWECSTCTGVGNSSRPMTMVNPESLNAETTDEAVIQARHERRVLVRMSKLVRSTVSETLASTIDDALSTGDDISWSRSRLLCLVRHQAITIRCCCC